MRFIAMAIVSCASWLIDPYDMAPVANRRTMDSTGSTSSIGTGVAAAVRRATLAASHGGGFDRRRALCTP